MTDEKKPAKAPVKKAAAKTAPKKATKTTTAAPKAAEPKKAAAPKKVAAPKTTAAAKSAVAAGIPEATAPVAKRKLTHDEISYRAYFIYIERNGQHGQHESDWLRAERELLELL